MNLRFNSPSRRRFIVESLESRRLLTAIISGQTVTGAIPSAGASDTYTFSASVGDSVRAAMADSANSNLAPELDLFGPNGALLASQWNYDTGTGGGGGTTISLASAPQAGVYSLVAHDHYGPGVGPYGLSFSGNLHTPSAPLPPTNLQVSQGTFANHIHLTWNASLGANGYEVWRNTTNDVSTASEVATSLTSNTFDDNSAKVGTTYYYWVRAKNLIGVSVFSASKTGYSAAGNLTVIAKAANSSLIAGAQIVRYDNAGHRLDSKTADTAGEATWTGLSVGTDVLFLYSPAGDLFAKGLAVIVAGSSTTATLTQSEPYEGNVRAISGNTDVTGGTATVGKLLDFVITVYNPTSSPQMIRTALQLKHGATSSTDFQSPWLLKTVAAHQSATFTFAYSPSLAASYFASFQVQTLVGGQYINTDSEKNVRVVTTTPAAQKIGISVIDNSTLAAGSVSSVTSSSPATATLTVHNKLSLWLDVITSAEPGPGVPGGFAAIHLVAPESDVAYAAKFSKSGDRISVEFTMGQHAGFLNILDVLLGPFHLSAIAPASLATLIQDIGQLIPLQKAYNELIHGTGSVGTRALNIINDLRMFATDTAEQNALYTALNKAGFSVTHSDLKKLFGALNVIAEFSDLAKQLVSLAALNGQLISGQPIASTFTAFAPH